MSRLRVLLLAVLALPAAVAADRDVNVVVDMTPEGRKLAHPTPDHPAYYYPWMRGYITLGNVEKGVAPPDPHAIAHLLAHELAKQGYVVVNAAHSTPDLMLGIQWGIIMPAADTLDQGTTIPDFGNDGHDATGDPTIKREMYQLVMGHTMGNPEVVNQSLYTEATGVSRYFIVVNAYDYADWAKHKGDPHHKRVSLWSEKISIASSGITFDSVVTPMLVAGAPMLGRETMTMPKLVPTVPEGEVKVGTPTVK